ncbi:MAG: HAMP domain-containing histidine kinase [Ignavibacteria bacterium]|nr:HAMP domain-containing histidine kinase [Ignavibacteria bacterium]
MRKSRTLLFQILAFTFSQFAWMGLLGLWIYWYVSNYLIFEQVGDQLSPQISIDSPNVFIFVGGIILIVAIAVAMFLIFRNLTIQFKLTSLYDNFIAHITHELKSPLSSIQLYLETLINKEVSVEKKKEFLGLMIQDTTRLDKLINSILEISRLEKKRIAHNYYVYDANIVFQKLIETSITNFRLSDKSINVLNNIFCKCVIDKDSMQIVFDNLFDNAIKYSKGDVRLNIGLQCNSRKAILEFQDYGIGINKKNQKNIFSKFYRIDNKNAPNVKGTGLGLYWVKEIIKLHGGKIRVESPGENMGVCFIIELPIYQSSKNFYINSLLRETAKREKLLGSTNE